MKYIEIPKLGKVSRIALGTAHYGKEIPEEIAFEELDLFAQTGGNLIDTAHFYGQDYDEGPSHTEITLGKWLAKRNRDDFIIATKGGFPHIGHMDKPRLDKNSLTSDIKASLDHLGTVPDIYFLHRDDPNMDVASMIEILNSFIDNGWTKYIGASNWSEKRIEEANKYAKAHGLKGFSISQLQFSMHKVTQEMLKDDTVEILGTTSDIAWYEKNNFPFMAYSPLVKGIFQNALSGNEDKISKEIKERYLDDENKRRIERAKIICKEYGYTPSEIMFGYIFSQKAPSIAIAASSKPEHIKEMLATSEIAMNSSIIEYLEGKRDSF